MMEPNPYASPAEQAREPAPWPVSSIAFVVGSCCGGVGQAVSGPDGVKPELFIMDITISAMLGGLLVLVTTNAWLGRKTA